MSTGSCFWNTQAFMQSFADAVAGGGGHGIIHGHDGQGAHRVAALPHHVHLRNLFGKRATGQGDAERAFPKLGGFFRSPVEQLSLA